MRCRRGCSQGRGPNPRGPFPVLTTCVLLAASGGVLVLASLTGCQGAQGPVSLRCCDWMMPLQLSFLLNSEPMFTHVSGCGREVAAGQAKACVGQGEVCTPSGWGTDCR